MARRRRATSPAARSPATREPSFIAEDLDLTGNEICGVKASGTDPFNPYVLKMVCALVRRPSGGLRRLKLKGNNLIGNDAVPMVLVAQKGDLNQYREVSEQEGRALAARWRCPFMEVSAKLNRNIGEYSSS